MLTYSYTWIKFQIKKWFFDIRNKSKLVSLQRQMDKIVEKSKIPLEEGDLSLDVC
jgi:hypothetical protein